MEAAHTCNNKINFTCRRRTLPTLTACLLILGMIHFTKLPRQPLPPPTINIESPPVRPLKAFISSAYYYPTSKSLGDNAVALLMSINLMPSPYYAPPDFQEIVISATNSTSSVTVKTPHQIVTFNHQCQIKTIFATAQLIPNVEKIEMVSDNGRTEIPFTKPSYESRDVVICVAPLFVSEQWQNFLFAVHIYKKYGAFVNLYLVSSVNTFYNLMKEYEEAGYLRIQPWVSVKFLGVPKNIADTEGQIELRSQAAAQSDCLLQYKESARFISFVDLDDVLIPRLAPTYVEEFQQLFDRNTRISYILYHKENYNAVVPKTGLQFSLKNMFSSLTCKHFRETGKSVVDPLRVNFTSLHFPPQTPKTEKYIVSENVITHLKTIDWVDDIKDPNREEVIEPHFYDNSSTTIISKKDIIDLEDDLQKMMKKLQDTRVFSKLPRIRYYSDLVLKCYNEKYYDLFYNNRKTEITCPGPHFCDFKQHLTIKCMRINATYTAMETLSPVTYYYATDPYFSDTMGCYAN
ncbi:Glycosyltransferase family 92 protein [Caenorhabditis elegans]|uniref:Glycosyltransferase family 92 protein n=1 Tax=Caenorhabditis elegans TaxID=6239 RepID=O16232_CAEEL|nr:Glycosyltransferase family 92 protein [Caenorhabditis elegans]CCD64331.2 Glycosyltransferase family 92 protein [Caenorhabditis elegans]|eukprot:NP_001343621.1 Uncharacterized protein CELE_F07G11.3 [Caenorhabditis elegans]